MSRILPERLRGCASFALANAAALDGSLYLNLLACVYLAAPEEAEPTLAHEYYLQASREHVDGDEVIAALMVEGAPS